MEHRQKEEDGPSLVVSESLDSSGENSQRSRGQRQHGAAEPSSMSSPSAGYVSECIDDFSFLLKMFTAQPREIDQEVSTVECQRVRRLVENLSHYLLMLLEIERSPSSSGRSYGLPADVMSFECDIVHPSLVEVLPIVLRSIVHQSARLAHELPILLLSFGKLCSRLLCVRMRESNEFQIPAYMIQEHVYDQLSASFRVLHMALDRMMVQRMLYGADLHFANNGGCVRMNDVSDMVFELENYAQDRMSDWVDVDCLRLPRVTDVRPTARGRFMRAVILDVFASNVAEGHVGGMELVMRALGMLDRVTVFGGHVLMRILHASYDLLSESVKESDRINRACSSICHFLTKCFSEDDFSEFHAPDDDNEEQTAGVRIQTAHHVLGIVGLLSDVCLQHGNYDLYAEKLSSYEKEVVLRLFESKNLSQQLASVKALDSIVTSTSGQFTEDAHSGGQIPKRISWVESSRIVHSMLTLNLHHVQYVEELESLMLGLIPYGLIHKEHVQHLWSIVEDDGTFEEIKCNAAQLLGSLAAEMSGADSIAFCDRLEGIDLSRVSFKYVLEMMTTAAAKDLSCRLMTRLIEVALKYALDDTIPESVGCISMLLDVFRVYYRYKGPAYIETMASVVNACMAKLEDDEPSRMHRPLRLLLRIFRGGHLNDDVISDLYKEVNNNAELCHTLLHRYCDFVLAQTEPNSRFEDLDESVIIAITIFQDILSRVLNESNYFVGPTMMTEILGLANNADRFPEFVQEMAWELLTSFVQGEKGVDKLTACNFVSTLMEKSIVQSLSKTSWKCITAYLAMIFDWESTLPVLPGDRSYTPMVVVMESNASLDVWNDLVSFLSDCVLHCGDDSIADEALSLMSQVLVRRMAFCGTLDSLITNVEKYKVYLEGCYDCIYAGGVDQNSSWSPVRANGSVNVPSFVLSCRILKYFQNLVRACGCEHFIAHRPLFSSFKDENLTFRVQFQHLPASPRPYGQQQSVEITCPRNSLVGDLRARVSKMASNLAGYFIPKENFNLHNQEGVALINDACGLHVVIQEFSNVYAIFTSRTERRVASIVAADPESDLTNLLGQDWSFIKMLLAFSDCHAGQFSNSDSSGYPMPSEMLCHISESAIDLLMSLPMCNLMKKNVISAVQTEDMVDIKRMVSGDTDDAGFSASAILYICIILHSQISPMDGVGVSPESLINSPLGLLRIIAGAYTKTTGLLRDRLARVCTHLTLSMISMSEKSPTFVEELQMFSLAMIHHPDLLCAFNDSVYIASGSLKVVLETFREQSDISDNVMKEYITTTKVMLQSECGQIRRLASEGILIMSQEHGLEDLVFDSIVSDVLLLRDPSNEQIELCVKVLHRMHGRRSNDMAIIANTISSCIATCLSERCNISGQSRCLQIAVMHIYSEEIPALNSLILEILQKYIFVGTDMISSKQEKDVYSGILNDSRYSLQQQDALYRLLITGALSFENCWDSVYHRLSEIFLASIERCSQVPPSNDTSLTHSLRDLNDYCGLLNGGATCYMNATFQQLFMQPRLRHLLLSLPIEEDEGKMSPIFEALRDVFITMCGGLGKVVNPSCFWRAFKDYDGNPVNVREHQDAYEFFTRLQDSVDEHLKSVGHPKVIHSVFGGSFNQIIEVPGQPDLRSEREEEFYQISVDVRGKTGLLESLDSYVAPETLDGQNQWFCEKIGRKVDAKKRTLIKKLPESLMFHFKRFEWDFETLSRWKIKDRFEFPTMIDMAPYVDSPESHQESMMYELSGIIVHSGTAFAGHYYSFAKERSSGQWFIFDDDSVAPWDISNIDDDCFGGSFIPDGSSKTYQRSQSAYIIMYDRACEDRPPPPACGFLDMFESIPSKCLSQIIESNLSELNKAFAFNPSLSNFICEVSRELSASFNGPRALKTKKFEGDHQIEQQGSNGVFYSHDRREDGNHPIQVKQALLLCLKYICNIMVSDAVPLRGDSPEHDPALCLLDSLQHVCSIPALARVVLDPSDVGEQSLLESYMNALTSPSKNVRYLVRELVATSVKALLNSPVHSDESLSLCHRWIEKATNRVSYALQNFSSVTQTWKDLITCLHDISCDRLGKSLLVEYVDALVSFSPSIHKMWRQQTKGQKLQDNFAIMYTNLVLPLLRMHKLENQDLASDLQQSNPFILRLSYGSAIKDCPTLFPVNDGPTVAMTVKALLLPGAVSSTECLLFMKWFAWEHKDRSDALVAAILLHIEDSSNLVDLASEVASIVDLLSMEDSYTASRVLSFLLGVDFDTVEPNEMNIEESILGALDACASSGSTTKAYLIICICLATKMSCPEVWSAIERDASLRNKLSQWIAMSKRICLHTSHKITRDLAFRKQWTDMIPAVTDNQMESFFDPAVLFDQFQCFPEHLNDTILLQTNNQAMIGDHVDLVPNESTERIQGVVCIKASHDDDEDDEVAEIDIPES